VVRKSSFWPEVDFFQEITDRFHLLHRFHDPLLVFFWPDMASMNEKFLLLWQIWLYGS
jgi:hypothetical protein